MVEVCSCTGEHDERNAELRKGDGVVDEASHQLRRYRRKDAIMGGCLEVASVLHGNHRDEWHKNQGNGGADDAPTAESSVVLQHFLAGGETCADSTTEIGHAENDRFFHVYYSKNDYKF